MYPYFYPSYFSQGQMGTPATPPGMGMAPGTGAGMGTGTGAGMVPNMADQMDVMEPGVPGTTSGAPSGPVAPPPPTIQPPAVDFTQEPGPPVLTNIEYTQAYLRTQIGKKVRVEFLIGTNLLTDRVGTLVEVGVSYILLQLQETDDILLGDIYSIKFVTIFH